jgi:hypothetical protein
MLLLFPREFNTTFSPSMHTACHLRSLRPGPSLQPYILMTSPCLRLEWYPSFRGVYLHISLAVWTLLLYPLYMFPYSGFPPFSSFSIACTPSFCFWAWAECGASIQLSVGLTVFSFCVCMHIPGVRTAIEGCSASSCNIYSGFTLRRNIHYVKYSNCLEMFFWGK